MTNYTEQQQTFVRVYLEEARTNDNYRDCCKKAKEAAGYSESYSTSQIISVVKDLIIEGMKLELAMMLPKLLNRLEAVIDNPSLPGAKSVIQATTTLMDRAGLIKPDENTIKLKMPDGILILPSKQEPTK